MELTQLSGQNFVKGSDTGHFQQSTSKCYTTSSSPNNTVFSYHSSYVYTEINSGKIMLFSFPLNFPVNLIFALRLFLSCFVHASQRFTAYVSCSIHTKLLRSAQCNEYRSAYVSPCCSTIVHLLLTSSGFIRVFSRSLNLQTTFLDMYSSWLSLTYLFMSVCYVCSITAILCLHCLIYLSWL